MKIALDNHFWPRAFYLLLPLAHTPAQALVPTKKILLSPAKL